MGREGGGNGASVCSFHGRSHCFRRDLRRLGVSLPTSFPTPVIYALIRERWRRMNRPPEALHSIRAVLFYDYGCADFGGGGGEMVIIIVVVPNQRVPASNSLVAELAALPRISK